MTEKTYADGIRDGVDFVLSHYEASTKTASMFIPVTIDPKLWWSQMILTPTPKYINNSQAHYEARKVQWQIHAKEKFL